MREGDTILHAARRVGGALLGKQILAIETPQLVQARGRGDDNRTTFWCPGCQR